MNIKFFKYQGAGNDFVIIDNRTATFDQGNHQLVNFLCDRRFGVGADGLMLLNHSEEYDFEMVYYNADGFEGSMCGNGGRCIVAFAYNNGMIKSKCSFIAVDGSHEAEIINHQGNQWVSLKMIDIDKIEKGEGFSFLDTGSPHYVREVKGLSDFNVFEQGKKIRNNDRFAEQGTNVNFIEINHDSSLSIRTYERGVEDETLACGTGVTAAVLSAHAQGLITTSEVHAKALGGDLKVTFSYENGTYKNVYLQGPAEEVFKGEIDVKI